MSSDGTKFRISPAQYLNAVPPTRGIEGEVTLASVGR
jgi:hypothetical protein